MSKLGLGIIPGIIIVVALIVAFSLPSEESSDSSSIIIVANLPITGPGSSIGIEERDGLQLAVDELNSFGGINDRNIELVIVDNETDLDKAKELFLETEQAHEPLLHISSLSFISPFIHQHNYNTTHQKRNCSTELHRYPCWYNTFQSINVKQPTNNDN